MLESALTVAGEAARLARLGPEQRAAVGAAVAAAPWWRRLLLRRLATANAWSSKARAAR